VGWRNNLRLGTGDRQPKPADVSGSVIFQLMSTIFAVWDGVAAVRLRY
jgi:hypothetical protein